MMELFFKKGFDPQGRGEPRRAHGRQDMVRPGKIIAGRFRGVGTEKNRAGMADMGKLRPGIGNHQLEMLDGDTVGQLDRLFEVIGNQDHPAVGKGLPGNFLDGKAPATAVQVRLSTASAKRFMGGDQDRQGQRIVFGLGQHIGGDTGGSAVASATISTSDGPAIISMRTMPDTCLLASATYWLPGPTITSTRGMVSVPKAKAPIAQAEPAL